MLLALLCFHTAKLDLNRLILLILCNISLSLEDYFVIIIGPTLLSSFFIFSISYTVCFRNISLLLGNLFYHHHYLHLHVHNSTGFLNFLNLLKKCTNSLTEQIDLIIISFLRWCPLLCVSVESLMLQFFEICHWFDHLIFLQEKSHGDSFILSVLNLLISPHISMILEDKYFLSHSF
jgi:hypothetical protein